MSDAIDGVPKPPLPSDVLIRQALPSDALAIHALMRPYVMQRHLIPRSEAEVIEMTRHGFVAVQMENEAESRIVGFSAVEIYSPKLAELQCLAVHPDYQRGGVGRALVARCVQRAADLNVMEVMAISSSDGFLQSCGFGYPLPDQKKALFYQLRARHIE